MFFFKTIFCSILIFFFAPVAALKKTNPDISVNILLLEKKNLSEEQESQKKKKKEEGRTIALSHKGHHHGEGTHSHFNEGFSVQELEFYFKSNIDPYWAGNVSLGISQQGKDFEWGLEEAYIESLFIPSWTLKAGKFYAFLGRHNNLHTHYYPFIDPPLIHQKLFGFHGWNNTGLSMAYLTPLPWYSEIILQAFYEHAKKKEVHSSNPYYADFLKKARSARNKKEEEKPFAGILFFKNLWDLNDSSTLELDLTYGTGLKTFKHLYNTALVWKWKTLDRTEQKSLSWTTEWMKILNDSTKQNTMGGISSYIQWQFLKQWWLEGRAEYLYRKKLFDIEAQKYSFLISFAATEYSAIRLQYDMTKDFQGKWEHSIAVQSNMSLGAHPAHLY